MWVGGLWQEREGGEVEVGMSWRGWGGLKATEVEEGKRAFFLLNRDLVD